jgi:hypothetical protein
MDRDINAHKVSTICSFLCLLFLLPSAGANGDAFTFSTEIELGADKFFTESDIHVVDSFWSVFKDAKLPNTIAEAGFEELRIAFNNTSGLDRQIT